MNPSIRMRSCASFRSARTSGRRRSARSRSNATRNSCVSSARITPRLPDNATGLTTHGNASDFASSRGFASIRDGEKPRHRQTGGAKLLARALLVARDGSGPGRMDGQIERLTGPRGDHRRPVAERNQSIEPASPRRVDDRRHRSILVMEPDRNGAVLPRILEHVAPVGREDQLDAKPFGRFTERARLVPGRRR